MPFLSVIIPFFGDTNPVEECLLSIRQSTCWDYEIILADDGSLDRHAVEPLAAHHAVRLVRLESNSGPGAARNQAALVASGGILVFLDADVTVHKDTLARIADAFRHDPSLDAIVGSYDLQPASTGLVALFRNLLHAHIHHQSAGSATTFWAGCGAVRREKFDSLGGFKESFRKPSPPHSGAIEDVEFGARLYEAGGKIRLDPAIQVTHHKNWILASMIYADVFLRARPWAELMMRHGLPRNLNFRWQDRLSVALAALLPALALVALEHRGVWWIPMLVALLAVGLLQQPILRFLARQRGPLFAAACFPLLLVHYFSAATGFLLGLLRWEAKRDRWFVPAALLFAMLIFGAIQFAGGAYKGEFDGQEDESSHFVTALMVRDYLVQRPLSNPLSWAEQYYLHYPRVRFGHWPPLFHLTEAAWFLLLPPSRVSALLLIGLLALLTAMAFYRVARMVAGSPGAILLTCLFVAAPLFQQSAALVMTEMLSLLCGLLFLDALIRLLRDGGRASAIKVALWAGLALMVSGIGACLVPAPFVALVLARQWNLLRLRFLAVPAIVALAVGLLWFPMTMPTWHSWATWAGVGVAAPWKIPYLLILAGPGFVVLAAAATLTLIRQPEPVAAACASVLLSTLAVSYVLRAMAEPRHWVLALPCLLLLGAVFVRRTIETLPGRARFVAAAALAALALALFPWEMYTQTPSGFAALADKVKTPARMLVSGSSLAEGAWISLISLREHRPSSVIVRSTKIFRLRASTPSEPMPDILDRMGIDTVILDDRPDFSRFSAADRRVRECVLQGAAWSRCAQSGQLSAYCRTQPPRVAVQPLKLYLDLYFDSFVVEK